MKTSKRNTGFTLVELLVVIVIISILSTLIISSINKARTKTRDSVRTHVISEIDKYLNIHWLFNPAPVTAPYYFENKAAVLNALSEAGYTKVDDPKEGLCIIYGYRNKPATNEYDYYIWGYHEQNDEYIVRGTDAGIAALEASEFVRDQIINHWNKNVQCSN